MAAGAAYLLFEEEDGAEERKERVYPDKIETMEVLGDRHFIQTYRLSKEAVAVVCDCIKDDLRRERTKTRTTLGVEQQVLIALRFMATGAFFGNIGNDVFTRCSKSTVSLTVHRVTEAICRRMQGFMIFPRTTEEKVRNKAAFYKLSGMPGCLGLIDGTLIAIQAPVDTDSVSAANYFCHKGYHALNTMVVCDADQKIIAVDATNPGANHDSTVWFSSRLKFHAETNGLFAIGEWLLGDAGYPLEPWLMTPVSNAAEGSGSERYNRAQRKTRMLVEQCIGLLKMRFRCLQRYRAMHFRPDRCTNIITACAILHNICIEFNVPLDLEDSAQQGGDMNDSAEQGEEPLHFEENPAGGAATLLEQARRIRESLIQNSFSA